MQAGEGLHPSSETKELVAGKIVLYGNIAGAWLSMIATRALVYAAAVSL